MGKRIGALYFYFCFFFGCVGGEATWHYIIRLELLNSVDPQNTTRILFFFGPNLKALHGLKLPQTDEIR